MRVLIATDAWHPQVNGVVRTYDRLAKESVAFGAEISFLTPQDFRTIPFPLYPEIRLALPDRARARKLIKDHAPDYMHVATEGPVGYMARNYCLRNGLPFTTSYHMKFPEYLGAFLKFPASWSYAPLRRFHNAGCGTMVATPSLACELRARGFTRLLAWTRGVDIDLFRPRDVRVFGSGKPVFLYVGRVSKEKNLGAFLSCDLPGRKVVVGDGPYRAQLQRRYPDAVFAGAKTGENLARAYASSDVFVFPSRTDTFGLVLLEAMASGVPVAAYPVTGPIDVVAEGASGILDNDLGKAARKVAYAGS